jgi:cell division protein ZapE
VSDLKTIYQALIEEGKIKPDKIQAEIVNDLSRVESGLLSWQHAFLARAFGKVFKGLYICGGVGMGKTLLMDLFYNNLNFTQKARYHFHAFMRFVDFELRRLQGAANPVTKLAKEFSKQVKVLCLDEFLVHDVADAMILAEFFPELFKQGIVLVVTSNTNPEDLYFDGVQRDRFLPVIALLQQHCQILRLNPGKDYRQGHDKNKTRYYYPLTQDNTQKFLTHFQESDKLASIADNSILIQKRHIKVKGLGEKSIWFAFKDLCHIPRSKFDYLELAEKFSTIFVSDVPCFVAADTSSVVLWIHLIDVLYDTKVQLVILAEDEATHLYSKGPFLASFARTLSRLQEMQSNIYD